MKKLREIKEKYERVIKRDLTRGEIRPTNPEDKWKFDLALITSRLLGPFPLLLLLWLVTAFKSGIGFWKALWVYPLILILCFAIPGAISTYFVLSGRVESFEWRRLKDRLLLAPLVFISLIINLILTRYLTNDTIFHLTLLLAFLIVSAFAVMLVFRLKISGHVGVASGVFWGINFMTNFQFWWLFYLLIPIIWARYYLKIHTPVELLSGFILSNGLIILAVLLFGLPNLY